MHVLATFLEKHGLVSEDRVLAYVKNSGLPQLLDAYQELHDCLIAESRRIITQDRHALDPFNFLAGASLRGDSGCAVWDCRLRKLEMLSRYAGLYCDRVIVPFELNLNGTDRDFFRFNITNHFLALVTLRPVIEAGAVALVVPEFHFCDDCMVNMKKAIGRIQRSSSRLCGRKVDQFKVYVRGPTDVLPPMVEMVGPEDYVEHGKLMTLLHEPPSWLQKVIPDNSGRRILARQDARRWLNNKVFQRIAGDAVFQQLWGVRYGLGYLTNLPAELEFFGMFDKESAQKAKRAAACAELTHAIPILADLPIETVLRIRKEEPDAFVLYRNSIQKILKEHLVIRKGDIGAARMREIWHDTLEPELTKLRKTALAARKSQRRKMATGLALPTVSITLAVHGGLLPKELSDLFLAVGGLRLLERMAEVLTSMEKDPLEVRNHNLYFLLRLQREG